MRVQRVYHRTVATIYITEWTSALPFDLHNSHNSSIRTYMRIWLSRNAALGIYYIRDSCAHSRMSYDIPSENREWRSTKSLEMLFVVVVVQLYNVSLLCFFSSNLSSSNLFRDEIKPLNINTVVTLYHYIFKHHRYFVRITENKTVACNKTSSISRASYFYTNDIYDMQQQL
jgi:hypothetical protein